MTNALTVFDGWELDAASAEEPRVRDVDVARRAGLAQPADVRRIIEKNWDELAAHGEISIVALSAKNADGSRGRGRPGTEYWLTEPQAVSLVQMMRTPAARALRVALVKLFVAWRRGQLAGHAAPPVLASVARIGDDPLARRDLGAWCIAAAKTADVSLRRVHGHVRKVYAAPGIYMIPRVLHDGVVAMLQSIVRGEMLFPRRPARILRLVAKNAKQLELPGPSS